MEKVSRNEERVKEVMIEVISYICKEVWKQ